jgi:hypothetical protein
MSVTLLAACCASCTSYPYQHTHDDALACLAGCRWCLSSQARLALSSGTSVSTPHSWSSTLQPAQHTPVAQRVPQHTPVAQRVPH